MAESESLFFLVQSPGHCPPSRRQTAAALLELGEATLLEFRYVPMGVQIDGFARGDDIGTTSGSDNMSADNGRLRRCWHFPAFRPAVKEARSTP